MNMYVYVIVYMRNCDRCINTHTHVEKLWSSSITVTSFIILTTNQKRSHKFDTNYLPMDALSH